eukprot:364354-Chlamydomonas_euryale.AAC.2
MELCLGLLNGAFCNDSGYKARRLKVDASRKASAAETIEITVRSHAVTHLQLPKTREYADILVRVGRDLVGLCRDNGVLPKQLLPAVLHAHVVVTELSQARHQHRAAAKHRRRGCEGAGGDERRERRVEQRAGGVSTSEQHRGGEHPRGQRAAD